MKRVGWKWCANKWFGIVQSTGFQFPTHFCQYNANNFDTFRTRIIKPFTEQRSVIETNISLRNFSTNYLQLHHAICVEAFGAQFWAFPSPLITRAQLKSHFNARRALKDGKTGFWDRKIRKSVFFFNSLANIGIYRGTKVEWKVRG